MLKQKNLFDCVNRDNLLLSTGLIKKLDDKIFTSSYFTLWRC